VTAKGAVTRKVTRTGARSTELDGDQQQQDGGEVPGRDAEVDTGALGGAR